MLDSDVCGLGIYCKWT